MATRTLIVDIPDLIAHVPVDRFEIINGPSAAKCLEIFEKMRLHFDKGVDVPFTLKTAASKSSFRRKIHITDIYGVNVGLFSFTANFANRVVVGTYNVRTHTGWFKLE